MRVERPIKALRQTSVEQGEADDSSKVPGADGHPSRARRRPGRAASLRLSSSRTRSQRWRSPKKGTRKMRRGNLVKQPGQKKRT